MTSTALEEWLPTARQRYLEAKDLSERLSAEDPEESPYESKYKAKAIVTELVDQLSQFATTADATDDHDIDVSAVIQMVLHYELGSIDLDTDDTPGAERHFQTCLDLWTQLIDHSVSDPNRVRLSLTLMSIVANNQMAFIWCSRNDFEKAIPYLKDAENAYNLWARSDDQSMHLLLDFGDVFVANPLSDLSVTERANDGDSKAAKNVESGHTLTLYLTAQTYEKLGDNNQSAVYCHRTLKRQYRHIRDNTDPGLYDRIDWALNAATLSQYFAVNDDFDASRHHICCALKVIDSSLDVSSDKYRKAMADLKRIVVKYCLMLLEASGLAIREQTLPEPAPESGGTDTLRPYLLNDPEVKELEKSIKTFPITTLTDAQQVFKYGNNCLAEAMSFYTIDERASDYVECIQDKSKLFQYLIPYDTDYERQCRMHKRRIDALEELQKQISPKHFTGQYRQILFELAEVYTQMSELKTHLMDDKAVDEQIPAAKKVNLLLSKAIRNYEEFAKTFADDKQSAANDLPQTLPEDYVRPVLLAVFSIGRLHSKVVTPDPREQLKNWRTCEQYYHKVKQYLDRNPDHKNHFTEELPLLDDMIELIPGKMQMILNSTMY